MKKLFALPLFALLFGGMSLALIPAGNTNSASYHPFTDTSNSAHQSSIEYLEGLGIVEGYGNQIYGPDNNINRAEFTKILVGAKGLDLNGCSNAIFPDAPLSQWYGPYVHEAHCQNWINGYPDGNFQPANNINYAEASKIVANAYGLPTSSSTPWFQTYVDAIDTAGSKPRTDIQPADLVTRGEMATMVANLIDIQNASSLLPNTLNVSLSGSEPFWGGTVNFNNFTLNEPTSSGPMTSTSYTVTGSVLGSGAILMVDTNFAALLMPGTCNHMSGNPYAYIATVFLPTFTYRGCANASY